ncbi:hypothetical protein DASC09_041610 [Saccharomycopsis crataegensis]|uniref:Uncharacterized protein n=1 Tax=Saccharomycopsis crataegensis TaxID=43959 RepID=A0AAV5QQ38_9ASCO|nr:hypothetical protein DASC09_041610 [Saccharomycopsis crataegensis]
MAPLTWFITGGSAGLGLALAKAALSKGDKVIVTSRSANKLSAIAAEGAIPVALDINGSAEAIDAVILDVIEKYGQIDVLVNNAGYGEMGTFEEIELSAIEQQFQTNFYGPVKVMKAFLPHMRSKRSGLVLNIGSVSAALPSPSMGIYGASKAALRRVSLSIDAEVKQFGVRVLVVEPGAFRTSITDDYYSSAFKLPAKYKDYDALRVEAEKLVAHLANAKGNPAVFGEILTNLAHHEKEFKEELPSILSLGINCYSIKQHILNNQLKELETFKEVSISTDTL